MNTLKRLSDSELIGSLKNLITKEREVLTDLLNHLKEVDLRKLHLSQGYSSLFEYLTEGMGYSEAAAHRRIQAMRLMKAVPEVELKLETGELSLSVASQLQTFIHHEDKKRKEERKAPVTQEEKQNLIESLQGTSARECEQKLAKLAPEMCLPKDTVRPITEDKVVIKFTAGKELLAKINKLKALWLRQNPEGSFEQLIEKLADLALAKADPERKSQKQSSQLPTSEMNPIPVARAFRPASSQKGYSRYIPKPLRERIWQRDQGRCQYKDPRTGRICRSNHLIEIDHAYPVALGGENSLSNLRLLCRNHNQYRQELLEVMNARRGP